MPNAGRDKYTDPISPLCPPSIKVWSDALKIVNTNPGRRVSNVHLPNSGYAFPEPGLFIGVTNSEKQARFFYNWLKFRPALLYRLLAASGAKPISNQLWRTMLSLPLERDDPVVESQTSSTTSSTKSNSRREIIQTLLAEVFKTSDIRLNLALSDNVFWHQHQVHIERLPELAVVQEILWELHELNFRFEFLALDHHAHDPMLGMNAESREEMVLACFPGSSEGVSMLVADICFAHCGLAAGNWQERAPHILAMKKVMQSWRGFRDVQFVAVDQLAEKGVADYTEQEIVAMETALAKFCTQSFFDFFGRAAIVPRRLASS